MRTFDWLLKAGKNPDRFNEIKKHIPWDDYTAPWVTFLVKYPITHSGLDRAFHKQKTVSGRIGVLSKWLLKVANKEGVSNELIKFQVQAKKEIDEWIPLYERWKRQAEDEIKTTPNTEFWDLVDLDRKITRYEEKIERYNINLRRASIMLIKEVT